MAARFATGWAFSVARIDRPIRRRADVDARRVDVAVKLDVAAERQRRDPPAGAPRIDPGPQFRPKSQRKGVDADAAPAPDQIMAELMDEHDRAEDYQERQDIPSKPGKQIRNELKKSHQEISAGATRSIHGRAGRLSSVLPDRRTLTPRRGGFFRRDMVKPRASATLDGVLSSPAACMADSVRSTIRAISPKPIRSSRNAATAISLAAFSAVGAPPPASQASMAMPSAGNRPRSASSNVRRPSAARFGRANPGGDPVGIGEAMGDGRAHVGRGHAGDQRTVGEVDQPMHDRLRMDDDGEPLGRHAEEVMGLDQLEPLVHQAGGIDRHLRPHHPVRMLERLRLGRGLRCARRSTRGRGRPRP